MIKKTLNNEEKKAFFLVSDENYFHGLLAQINSILQYFKDAKIYLIHDLPDKKLKIIEPFVYKAEKLSLELFEHLPDRKGHITKINFAKFFPDFIEEEHFMYLDTDVVVLREFEFEKPDTFVCDVRTLDLTLDNEYVESAKLMQKYILEKNGFIEKGDKIKLFLDGAFFANKKWVIEVLRPKIIKCSSELPQAKKRWFGLGFFNAVVGLLQRPIKKWGLTQILTLFDNENALGDLMHFVGKKKPWQLEENKFEKIWKKYYDLGPAQMPKLKIAYMCLAAYGHMDWGGVKEMLQLLKKRGHDVTLATGPFFKEYVENWGIDFVDLGIKKIEEMKSKEFLLDVLVKHQKENFFNVDATINAYEIAEKYYKERGLDVVISDSFSKVARLISANFNIPHISIDTQIPSSLVTPEMVEELNKYSAPYIKKMKDFIKEGGLKSADLRFIVPSTLNISFSTPEFDGEFNNPNSIYVGASSIFGKKHKFDKKNVNVFYSSGTLFWDKNQVNTILRLAKEKKNLNLYITAANILQGIKIPKNVKFYTFTNDSVLFPEMDIIISQGGVGTATKAIRSGIPLVVVPLFFSNYAIAKKTEKYGNGKALFPDNFSYSNLQKIITDIVNNYEEYKNKADKLQENFESLGGSEKAADILELEVLKNVK